MAHRLKAQAGKTLYDRRQQTVKPVFGIINEVMRFRRFLLREREKVLLEWLLVCVRYNLKRLFMLKIRAKNRRSPFPATYPIRAMLGENGFGTAAGIRNEVTTPDSFPKPDKFVGRNDAVEFTTDSTITRLSWTVKT